jgi:hypothetical protein
MTVDLDAMWREAMQDAETDADGIFLSVLFSTAKALLAADKAGRLGGMIRLGAVAHQVAAGLCELYEDADGVLHLQPRDPFDALPVVVEEA